MLNSLIVSTKVNEFEQAIGLRNVIDRSSNIVTRRHRSQKYSFIEGMGDCGQLRKSKSDLFLLGIGNYSSQPD